MVICKLSPIVGLYTPECEGWCKELGGVFKEIYGRLRIPARVDAFVLNPGSAVYDVVLVAAPFPVLYVHLLSWRVLRTLFLRFSSKPARFRTFPTPWCDTLMS